MKGVRSSLTGRFVMAVLFFLLGALSHKSRQGLPHQPHDGLQTHHRYPVNNGSVQMSDRRRLLFESPAG
jgi:hypothetical protein